MHQPGCLAIINDRNKNTPLSRVALIETSTTARRGGIYRWVGDHLVKVVGIDGVSIPSQLYGRSSAHDEHRAATSPRLLMRNGFDLRDEQAGVGY